MESGKNESKPARIYDMDLELLHWKMRKESAARNKTLSIAVIIHELLAPVRQERREEQRERGST